MLALRAAPTALQLYQSSRYNKQFAEYGGHSLLQPSPTVGS